MSIQVGDILKVVAILQWLDGDIAQNVYNTVVSGAGGPYDESDVTDDMLEWVEDMQAPLVTSQSDEIDGSEVRVYVYDAVDDDWDEIGSTSWTYNPSNVGEQLPRGVAFLINCKTSDPDVNGKKYLPGGTESNVTDGLVNAGMLAAIAAYSVLWVGPFTGSTSSADFTPGVWSPTRTNFYQMTEQVITPTIPAYQRRRKRGVGI